MIQYLIVNRLFVLSFENEDDTTSFSKYYTPNVEMKNVNIFIDGKSFSDVPIKNKEETYQKIIETGKYNIAQLIIDLTMITFQSITN